MIYTPDSLRALFKRSTAKRGEWNLSMLEVALSLHADAWDRQANSLVGRLADIAEDNAALRKRLEEARGMAARVQLLSRHPSLLSSPLDKLTLIEGHATRFLTGEEKP
jgi:hypothetical protein